MDKNTLAAVLQLLETKYGWNFSDSLTKRGEKLVEDTIAAVKEIENIPIKLEKRRKIELLTKWLNKH